MGSGGWQKLRGVKGIHRYYEDSEDIEGGRGN